MASVPIKPSTKAFCLLVLQGLNVASSVPRECHRFANPYGLRSRVVTGTGTGWQFEPPENPYPWHGFDGYRGRCRLVWLSHAFAHNLDPMQHTQQNTTATRQKHQGVEDNTEHEGAA